MTPEYPELLAVQRALTVILYFWFGGQCLTEWWKSGANTFAARAFLALAGVFVLCSISGYGVPLLKDTFGVSLPLLMWGHVAAHTALPIVTFVLIQMKGVHHIYEALNHGRG